MKIELKHDLGAVILTTPHNDPDEPVSPTIEFEPVARGLEDIIRRDFERETRSLYGHYGHSVDIKSTTNLDLRAAVHQMPSFKVILLEPERIKPNPLPEGVDT